MAKMYTCSYVKSFENRVSGRWKMNEEDVYGSWRIMECDSPGTFDNCDLAGTEFMLDEAGDVRWKTDHAISDCLPFLTCDGYELSTCPDFKYKDCDQDSLGCKLNLLGSETGELVPFLLTLSRDKTMMTMRYQYSPMLILKCKKIVDSTLQGASLAYSLLPALQNALFCDITITADNGRQFQAHKAILLCACPTVNWLETPPPLANWPPDAIEVTLHYFYTGCLPMNVKEETVEKIHRFLEHNQGMKKLHEICAQYLESTALKRKICNILDGICSVIDEAYDFLNEMKNKESPSCGHSNSLCSPENFLAATKEMARFLALAFARFALFCEIFTKYKAELSRSERHEIIRSIKTRLLAVEGKLRQCAEIALETLSTLTMEEQKDLAKFFVPELDHAIEVGTRLAMSGKDALDNIVQTSDREYRKKPKKKVGMKLSKALQMSMFSKEIQLLKKLQQRASSGYVFFFQRREDFNSLAADGKASLVFNCIQYAISEGAEKLEEFTLDMPESKFSLKGWKAFTKLVTSKLTWLIKKMKSHNTTVEPILLEVSVLVKKKEFENVLEELELIKCHYQEHTTTSQRGETSAGNKVSLNRDTASEWSDNCPTPASISLSKSMGALLQTGQFSDMTFVICDNTSRETTESEECKETNNSLHAHRVVVASRCDWFRRALTSGMKESIDRKIHIYDTDRESFLEFLKYIYTGAVMTETKSIENLLELLTLSDRYEVDNLKIICEKSLVAHFRKDNIFELLVLADRFNAPILKSNVFSFIKARKQLRYSKAFSSLPLQLQQEAKQQFKTEPFTSCDVDLSSSDDSECDSDSFFSSRRIGAAFNNFHLSETESSEDEYTLNSHQTYDECLVDKQSLEDCLVALREVLPSDVPRAKLVEIALAADYDINRAINHYFS